MAKQTGNAVKISFGKKKEGKAKNTKKRKKRAIMVAMLWSEITVF